ncbi:MAG: hypothetical protein A3G35_11695 [candidate division NC10 bacterium RIFCSPLOWO2_12_FULL_66_18]|nr:MAG: hypothetical protein A3H39_19465 [candidate division NC10 bacterium RIFCSPLOWO2_02_FULL_66_22]OGB97721.1 MAG: hypothetical protein A3G35_11695 [candidate division NC10 bacterium RIFCSPLOWO2_12_FULL_66_18]
MIVHISEVEGYEAPGELTRVLRFLVDAERTNMRKLTAVMLELEPGQKTHVASHPAEEIYIILEGHPLVRVGDEERTVGPETVLAIASNEPHQISAPEDKVRCFTVASDPPLVVEARRSWKRVK